MTLTDRRILCTWERQEAGPMWKLVPVPGENIGVHKEGSSERIYTESDVRKHVEGLKSKIADLKIKVEENGMTTEIDLDEPFYREMIEKKIKDVMGEL